MEKKTDENTPSPTVTISLKDAYLFLVSAVSYSLGRRTYLVRWACDQVHAIAPKLEPAQREILIRDIEEHGESGLSYGTSGDKREWLSLLEWLKSNPAA